MSMWAEAAEAQFLPKLRALEAENVKLRALLREVFDHGENFNLHRRIGAVFGLDGAGDPLQQSEGQK